MVNAQASQNPVLISILERRSLDVGDLSLDEIQALGDVRLHDHTPQDRFLEHARGAQILVVNKAQVSDLALQQLPDLRMVSVTATGYDCVDIDAARRHNVIVCNVPEYSTEAVAQHVFALLLAHCRAVERHDALIRHGEWKRRGEFCFWDTPQVQVDGWTLGIVGWGRIGRRVARIGDALGMRILVTRRRVGPATHESVRFVSLDELFESSDVVSLHCPLTTETRHLVNADLLSRMKPTAVLINTARGGLIDEQALVEALARGHLACAALDTLSEEPIPDDHPLLSAPRCILTPHLAWATGDARRRLVTETAHNIHAFLSGTPRNVVT